MSKRVKTTYDRGYVNAMNKIRVFIESNQKVMYIDTGEYKNAQSVRAAYARAFSAVRAVHVRPWRGQRTGAAPYCILCAGEHSVLQLCGGEVWRRAELYPAVLY